MALRSWSKNRELQQRHDVENQRRDIAEIEHLDVAMLLHDVATFGVGFGWIFSPFEPIMEGFKAQTRGIKNEGL